MFDFKRDIVRGLRRHIVGGHKLRVQLSVDRGDLELYCVYCGCIVAAGTPAKMNEAADALLERGVTVTKYNNPTSSIRIH
jgi:hypothetical protein